ncbi:MAG TPA: hypothetical protein VF290_07860 [Pyrinomonadaceae bacterium]
MNAVVFYEKPLLKADRLIETYLGVAPAFLVLDRNRNGLIGNGTELFGNFSP